MYLTGVGKKVLLGAVVKVGFKTKYDNREGVAE